jgi:hypothetical protein
MPDGAGESARLKVERLFGGFSKEGEPMEFRNRRGCRASMFPFAGRVALGIVGLLLAGAPGVLAEGKPYLLRDINEAGVGSSPSSFTAFGDRLFFKAYDGTHGHELWALPLCPDAGDTHCQGLEVQGPEGGGPGTYVATASAQDDSGDWISYTFRARRGDEAPIVVGPQAGSSATLDLDEGAWTISVEVDDDPGCTDVAADAARSVVVKVIQPGGLQRPGDSNQDGKLDLSDAVWLLGHLFLGSAGQETLPCEGGTASSPGPGDLALADVNGDVGIDVSDPVSILGFLFLGGSPPALGTECVRTAGCPEQVGCH